jgi:hypothetical protein
MNKQEQNPTALSRWLEGVFFEKKKSTGCWTFCHLSLAPKDLECSPACLPDRVHRRGPCLCGVLSHLPPTSTVSPVLFPSPSLTGALVKNELWMLSGAIQSIHWICVMLCISNGQGGTAKSQHILAHVTRHYSN